LPSRTDHGLVDAAPGLGERDGLVVVVLGPDDPHRREVDAGDLELRRELRPVVGSLRVGPRDPLGEHDRLLPQRRHEAVDLAAVLGALADDVDVRLVHRAHRVVDDDPPLDLETGARRELGVRPDAGRHDDHVAVQPLAVAELESHDVPAVAADARRARLEVDVDAELLDAAAQDRRGLAVELDVHEAPGAMDDVDLHPALEQPARGLQTEQAAADHGDAPSAARPVEHRVGIGDGAKAEDAGDRRAVVEHAVDRREERAAARGDDELVVAVRRAVGGVDGPRIAIDRRHAHAGVQRDRVALVPVERVEEDPGRILGAGEDVRQRDAVVVAVRLVAEHRDVEQLGAAAFEDLLDRAGAGHAVADDDQALPGGGCGRGERFGFGVVRGGGIGHGGSSLGELRGTEGGCAPTIGLSPHRGTTLAAPGGTDRRAAGSREAAASWIDPRRSRRSSSGVRRRGRGQRTHRRRGLGRSSRPTFEHGRPFTRTMSAVKSFCPRSSDDPTP
jgi:hypothetical protein